MSRTTAFLIPCKDRFDRLWPRFYDAKETLNGYS
jgi:hypothetical protein